MTANSEPKTAIDEVIQQLQSGSSLPAELLEIFSEEAEDHLRVIYDGLQKLRNGNDCSALAEVRRSSHTLKGAAGAVNLQAATRLAHRMEDLLDQLTERSEGASEAQLDLFLATADQLQTLTASDFDLAQTAEQIAAIYDRYDVELGAPAANQADSKPVESALDQTITPGPTETTSASSLPAQNTHGNSESAPFLRVPLDRVDDLMKLLGEMTVNRFAFQHRLEEFESRIEDMQSTMERLRNVSRYVENEFRERPRLKTVGSSFSDHSEFDQLEFDRYDEFQLLTQTLSEADHDAEIMSGEFRKVKSAFSSLLQRQQQLNHHAQKSLMKVRMVPLATIVNRLERTVRTVANKIDKQVELVIHGERIELDKTVLDAIVDPILHLIRNAMDHGIESKQDRMAAGKPEIARIKIMAINQGTQVTLCISDDGAGINLDKVRHKAIEQELILPTDDLSDNELLALVFRPGFSTANQLTDVSGRGVGMDVVGEAIRRLKGNISVDSQPGKGTKFTIELPTSVGVSKAVLVESNGRTFAIPMESIRQIQRLDSDQVIRDEQEFQLAIGNQQIRLVDLATQLHLGSPTVTKFQDKAPLLVLGNGMAEVAVTVDVILGSREIVVKGLGNHLRQVPGISGATLAGDGSVIPILDTRAILEPLTRTFQQTGDEHVEHVSPRNNLAMVIDDSISVRRVTENMLKLSGWDVVTAKDGVDALETLATLDTMPDIFLCDLEMPRMNGLELIRQIREDKQLRHTPIVMVTSRASEKHRHKAFEAGATDYVVKPYHEEDLLDLITHLVRFRAHNQGQRAQAVPLASS